MQLLRFVGNYKKKMFLLQSASTYLRRGMVAVHFFHDHNARASTGINLTTYRPSILEVKQLLSVEKL